MQCLFVYETHYRLQGSADGFKDALTLEGRLLNVTMLVYQQQLVEFEFFPVHSRAPAWQILQFAVSGLVPYFTAVEQEPKLLFFLQTGGVLQCHAGLWCVQGLHSCLLKQSWWCLPLWIISSPPWTLGRTFRTFCEVLYCRVMEKDAVSWHSMGLPQRGISNTCFLSLQENLIPSGFI